MVLDATVSATGAGLNTSGPDKRDDDDEELQKMWLNITQVVFL